MKSLFRFQIISITKAIPISWYKFLLIKNYFLKYATILKPTDFISVAFFLILICINLIFHSEVTQWFSFIMYNLLTIILILFISYKDYTNQNHFWRLTHYWFLVPLILFSFKQMYFLIHPIRKVDYDFLLIEIDRFLFGTDPTLFIIQYAHPFITEILQIIYGTFYFLPIILCLDLYSNKKYYEVDYATFLIVFGFFISFLAYFIFPAIGPRFTLHNFENINNDLPGIFLTNYLRELVNIGESIPKGTINPAAVVQRDVFPSGHTMITAIVIYLSIKFNVKWKYFFIIIGSLLIFSTVYLLYHYVIDVIAGLIFMAFTVWTGNYFFNPDFQKISTEKIYGR